MNVVAPEAHPVVFELHIRTGMLTAHAEMVVCNSFHEVEAGAFKILPPNVVPIGPLTSDRELRKPVGQFLPEDTRCLQWLGAQPNGSVVYVAFGSFTVFDPRQFCASSVPLGGAAGLPHRRPEQGVVRDRKSVV